MENPVQYPLSASWSDIPLMFGQAADTEKSVKYENSTSPSFDKLLDVRIQQNSMDTSIRHLRVRVAGQLSYLGSHESSTVLDLGKNPPPGTNFCDSSNGSSVFAMELVDPMDHLFYWLAEMNEHEFHLVKTEQRLLLDFYQFPAMICALIHHAAEGKLAMILNYQSAGLGLLSFVEFNNYRELTHLTLKLSEASDFQLKKRLGHELMVSLDTLGKTQQELKGVHQELQASRETVHQLDESLISLKSEDKSLRESLALDKQECLLEARRQWDEDLRNLREAHRLEKEELLQKKMEAEEEVNRLQRLVDQETHQNTVSRDQSVEEIRQLTLEVSTLETRYQEQTTIKEDLHKQFLETHQEHVISQKQVIELEEQLKVVQAQLALRDLTVDSETKILAEVQQQKEALSESVSVYKQQTMTLKEKFDMSVKEINKGNTIIQKLQSQVSHLKYKVKKLKSTELEVEKSLISTRQQNESFSRDLSEHALMVSDARAKEAEILKQLERKSRDLDEAHAVIASNENVIQFLNKKITESELSSLAPTEDYTTGFNYQYLSETSKKYLVPDLGVATAEVPKIKSEAGGSGGLPMLADILKR